MSVGGGDLSELRLSAWPFPAAQLDRELNFIGVNQAYAEAHGREPAFYVGKSYLDLHPTSEHAEVFRRVVETGESASIRMVPGEPENGPSQSHGDWIVQAVADGGGAVTGLILSVLTVTECIKALEALGGEAASYRLLLECTRGFAWQADPSTLGFSSVGPEAESVLGYPSGAWYEAGFWAAHLHPEDRDGAVRICSEAAAGLAARDLEYRMIAADGSVLWIRDTAKIVSDEAGRARLHGFMFDITDRKRIEAGLAERAGLLNTVVRNAPIVLWALDADGVLTFSDGKGLTAFGLEPGELVGRSVFELYADVPQLIEDLRRALSGESFVSEAEVGDLVYVTYHSPLLSDDGTLAGVIGVSVDVTARKRSQRALEESERKYRELVDEAASIILRWDTEGNVTFFNEFAQQFFGYSEEEILGKNVVGTIVPEKEFTGRDLASLMKEIQRAPATFEYNENENVKRNGERVWVAWKNRPVCDESGSVVEVLSVGIDITARKRAEEQMRKHSSALEQTADTVVITDRDGIIEYVNRAFEQTTGYSEAEAIGRKANLTKSGMHEPGFHERLWSTILDGNVFSDVFINRRKDGKLYYEEKTITPLKGDHGVITHFIATGKDITERVQIQERLQYLAHHDVLTGLPNRVLFTERLEHAVALRRDKDKPVAVLFLDLDRFKIINDTLGHVAGDRALRMVAERLQQCVRKGDTVARLGGDEFAILLEDAEAADRVAWIARKVLDVMSRPFSVEQHEYLLTASIGISTLPRDGQDSQTLLKHADIAMYRAKEGGGNTYQFYSHAMGVQELERLTLETSLRRALDRGEFVLHYQPQLDIDTGEIVGAEALLRWEHPELGLVAPEQFIATLEETGLILPVSEWVLRTACEQARVWQREGERPVRITVNLSARQFNTASLIATISGVLSENDLAPELLELEVTESVLMQHSENTIDSFAALDAMGVRLVLDDFGTGYSSLSYLKRFPVDGIKIDRAFTRDITFDADGAAIVRAIVAMAETLNLQVVAEGVETEKQLASLRSKGCHVMQGFLFSAPVPAGQVSKLMGMEA